MIIDTHMHLDISTGMYNYQPITLQGLVDLMRELDIVYSISCFSPSISGNELERQEEIVQEAYELSHGAILAYHYYDPRVETRSLAFMEKHADDPMYVGIKIHPSMSYTDAADDRYRPCWDFARAHKIPIMSHTWDLSQTNYKQKFSFPTRFERYLEEYPDVTFIMGHSGGRFNGIRAAVELGKRFPQVYYDIAGDIHIANLLKYLVDNLGDRRILYDSDYVMMDQRTQLGAILGADLPMESKEHICYDNAAGIFGLSKEVRA